MKLKVKKKLVVKPFGGDPMTIDPDAQATLLIRGTILCVFIYKGALFSVLSQEVPNHFILKPVEDAVLDEPARSPCRSSSATT